MKNTADFFVNQTQPFDKLLQIFVNQTRHLEDAYLCFSKDGFELEICIDHALVCSILQIVGFNVNPQLFDDFSAW